MSESYFFYDLETSGLDPRDSRVMQFAGQRTDTNLKLIGEPYDFLVKLSPDVLPSPQAILVTGITPQMTLAEGIIEAEFLKIFNEQISTPGTTFIGYNNVRFDDEFIRYANYRNFYEPYEWHYKDGRKRWDLLEVIRMTRALRPDGINWPVGKDGVATNKLTEITEANNIVHKNAHSAMADVTALIEVARLIQNKQPKLFKYLNTVMPDKNEITKLLNTNLPLIYSSGGYFTHPSKTTAVVYLDNLGDGSVLVYDLRLDPKKYAGLSNDKLKTIIDRENELVENPFIVLRTNKCPALAPLSVLDSDSESNINLKQTTINEYLSGFRELERDFRSKAVDVYNEINSSRKFEGDSVDAQLYDKFYDREDSIKLAEIRKSKPESIDVDSNFFKDERLNKLIFLYKARNYPKALSGEETIKYDSYRQKTLFDGGANSRVNKFVLELSTIESKTNLTSEQKYILDELKLYVESIVPSDL